MQSLKDQKVTTLILIFFTCGNFHESHCASFKTILRNFYYGPLIKKNVNLRKTYKKLPKFNKITNFVLKLA